MHTHYSIECGRSLEAIFHAPMKAANFSHWREANSAQFAKASTAGFTERCLLKLPEAQCPEDGYFPFMKR